MRSPKIMLEGALELIPSPNFKKMELNNEETQML